jgi:hypothetical protein
MEQPLRATTILGRAGYEDRGELVYSKGKRVKNFWGAKGVEEGN